MGPQIQSFSLAHEKTNNNVLYVLVISRFSQNFWKRKSNMRFCFFPLHCDWARKLAQFSQSIRYRTKTKRHLVTCVLPRFKKNCVFLLYVFTGPFRNFLGRGGYSGFPFRQKETQSLSSIYPSTGESL